jgi:acetyl esterase/lipase
VTADHARRLAPALRHLATFRVDLNTDALPVVRASLDARRRGGVTALDTRGVEVVDATTPESMGHSVNVRIYRGGPVPAPVVVYCHSGAFVLGNLDTDYRLAPEHPFPAALRDALTVLEWVVAEAKSLGIDADRVAVAGNSAGGALAATLAQCAAVGAAPAVAFQILHQPVLDDRPTPSKGEFDDTPGFDGEACERMWRHLAGGAGLPAEAVPARLADPTGVAPALITCSELDPLRDEAIDYALRLMWAGVPTELHVFPGTCHGFDSMAPECDVSQALFAMQGEALRRALAG